MFNIEWSAYDRQCLLKDYSFQSLIFFLTGLFFTFFFPFDTWLGTYLSLLHLVSLRNQQYFPELVPRKKNLTHVFPPSHDGPGASTKKPFTDRERE